MLADHDRCSALEQPSSTATRPSSSPNQRLRKNHEAPTSRLAARVYPSPLGDLTLIAGEAGLRALLFPRDASGTDGEATSNAVGSSDSSRPGSIDRTDVAPQIQALLDQTAHQLDEYFARQRTCFAIPLDLQGTPFSLRAWAALLEIPYGTTISYGQQARRMGAPGAVRAVGTANGRNPISIIVPCHRVIGANGKLTGYGGGMEAKAYLLGLEGGALEGVG